MSLADRIGPRGGAKRGGSHGDRSPRPGPYSRPQLEPAPEDGLWKHDKFAEVNGLSEGGLSARISSGSAGAPTTKLIQQALSATNNGTTSRAPILRNTSGFSIKGAGAKESTTLEIKQLVTGTTPEDVKMIFSQCGKITDVKSMPCDDPESVIIQVTFEKNQDMKNAIRQFNGQQADGRTLVVEEVPLPKVVIDASSGPFDLLDNGGSAGGKMYSDAIEGGSTLTHPPRINDSSANWSRGSRGGGRRGGSGFRGTRRGSNRGASGGNGGDETMQVDG